ncbi:MAG TPA: anti-sigma factor [Thermomicrobiales bacterium]|nr:anti-sigma factor [Thermomicrobiales bacterium]
MNQPTIDHSEVRDHLTDYVLDDIDEGMARAIRAHLDSCPECRAIHDQLADGLASLGTLVLPAEMPAGHRDRFLARLEATPTEPAPVPIGARRSGGWLRYGAAAAIAVLLAASALAFYLSRSDGEGGRMLDPRAVEILASAPAAIPLVADAATEAYGTLFVAPDATEALLVVDDLPASEPDTVYQVWLVRDGERTSGGTFTVNGGHDAAMIVSAPQPIAAFQALGITIEPAPDGSPGPTGPRVVSCSLEELPT